MAGQNGGVGSTTEAEAVVRELCSAVSDMEAERLRPLFTSDVVYHNIPMEPAVGIDAAMGFLETFLGMFEHVEFRIRHLACTGNVVLTERTDVFTNADVEASLPVMGTFEVADGKIKAWRDYFDMAQVTGLLGG